MPMIVDATNKININEQSVIVRASHAIEIEVKLEH